MSEDIKKQSLLDPDVACPSCESDESSFEDKIKKAKDLLEELVNPEITLSKSVEVYKNGMKELEEATKLLNEAKLEFETLNKN